MAERNVYRLDPGTRELTVLASDFVQPNGIAFSPDETLLYVADTGATHGKNGPRHIRRFRVVDGSRIEGGEIFATSPVGLYDGFRIDTDGRLWTSTGDGVCVYDPDGTLIGRVKVPEVIANVEFGGPKLNYLFICATTSLYAIRVTVNGARRP
jgi:gluconolactonase